MIRITELRYKAYFQCLKDVKQLSYGGFSTFDIETSDGLEGNNIFCWSLAYSKGGKRKKLELLTGKSGNFQRLLDLFGSKKHKTRWSKVYAHNMEFDVRHIINYCDKKGIDYNVRRSGSKMICVKIKEFKVMFIDSLQFLNESQEKAEISWNVNPELRKIDCSDLWDMDFKNWSDSDKKRLVEHNKNDVLALYEIIQKWRIAVFQVAKVDPISEISMSKLSLKSYRVDMRTNSFIPMHKTDLVNPKRALINPFLYPQRNAGNDARTMFSYRIRFPEYEFTRDAYFGGKCEVYDTNTLENHAYFDRNSMYPKVMFDKFYPIGLPKFSKDKAEIWRIIKNKDERLAIIRVKITPRKSNNFPLLPIRLEQKVMFTNHTRIWNYTSVELHEAWKDGAKIKIVKALIFPGKSQIFRGYISKMYEFRKKFSLEKDAGKNKLAKKLMNTLYGKFGERMVKKQMQYKFFKNREDCVEFAIQKGDELKDEMSMLEKKYQLMPYIRFKERPETKGEYRLEWIENRERAKPFMLTHLAVFVTSYARINLWKLQNTLAKQGILTKYCDTDSLVVKLKYKDKLPLGKELGDWKIEKEFKRVKFLAPKAYIGMDKNGKLFAKLKGLDKFAMKKILSQCIFLEELEQKIRKRIAIDEMYMKYSQSCHYGEILCSKTSTKMFKFENLKRKFDKETGLSEPYNDGNLPEYLKIPEKAL